MGQTRYMMVPKRRVGVLDTDALMNDLARRVESDESSPALALPHGLGTTWLAARHVFDEFYAADELGYPDKFAKLAEQASNRGLRIGPERFRTVFETSYLPAISFVDIGVVLLENDIPQSVTHNKDVPTAQLAALVSLAECVVYSHDKHLRGPKIAPAVLEPVVEASRVASVGDAIAEVAFMGGTVGAFLLTETVGLAAKTLRTPKLVAWSALAVLIAIALADEQKRNSIGKRFAPAGKVIASSWLAGEDAKLLLRAAAITGPPAPPLECWIAMVLVHSRRPLLVREIREEFGLLNKTLPLPNEQRVRALLGSLPCFVEAQPHRWRLGALLRPPFGRAATSPVNVVCSAVPSNE